MNDIAENWAASIRLVFSVVALMWLIEAINTFFGHAFNVFGIYPREIQTLPGVLLWPFLHGNFHHMAMNTMPLLILGFFVAVRGVPVFLKASLMILVLGGIGVWLFGRSAFHIGASGLVFGYFGFLVAIGIYEKRLSSLAVASFAMFYYGGLIYGVLPTDSFVSWEGHLFGLIAGVASSRVVVSAPHEESA